MNAKLVKKEKAQLYKDMKAKTDAVQAEYQSYKKFAEAEIEVAHAVIERQKAMHQKLFAELRAAKIVLEVPKFRD